MRYLTLGLFFLACTPLLAQSKPCGPEYHLFDFWIGEWDVYAGGNKVGENSIQPILDGCVLQEMWSGAKGSKGSSFNYYNPQTKKWNQYWVWKRGTPLPLLTGQYDKQKRQMILGGIETKPDGSKLHHRITWTHNKDDSVRQYWENSKDGKTWTVSFDGHYKKKKK